MVQLILQSWGTGENHVPRPRKLYRAACKFANRSRNVKICFNRPYWPPITTCIAPALQRKPQPVRPNHLLLFALRKLFTEKRAHLANLFRDFLGPVRGRNVLCPSVPSQCGSSHHVAKRMMQKLHFENSIAIISL